MVAENRKGQPLFRRVEILAAADVESPQAAASSDDEGQRGDHFAALGKLQRCDAQFTAFVKIAYMQAGGSVIAQG